MRQFRPYGQFSNFLSHFYSLYTLSKVYFAASNHERLDGLADCSRKLQPTHPAINLLYRIVSSSLSGLDWKLFVSSFFSKFLCFLLSENTSMRARTQASGLCGQRFIGVQYDAFSGGSPPFPFSESVCLPRKQLLLSSEREPVTRTTKKAL